MRQPPTVNIDVSALSATPTSAPQVLSDAFGSCLMSARAETLALARTRIESEDERAKMGAIFRKTYDAAATLGPAEREIAMKLAERCLDAFAREILLLLGNRGLDLKVDPEHALQFQIIAAVLDIHGNSVFSANLSAPGHYLPDEWGRWINRFNPD